MERGHAEARRATLPQRGCCPREPQDGNAEAFKLPLGAIEAWLYQASQPCFSWCYQGLQRHRGAEAWDQSDTEARITPVLSVVSSC